MMINRIVIMISSILFYDHDGQVGDNYLDDIQIKNALKKSPRCGQYTSLSYRVHIGKAINIDSYYYFRYFYHYIRYLTRLNLQFSLQYVFLSTPTLVLTAIYVNSIFWNTVNKSI